MDVLFNISPTLPSAGEQATHKNPEEYAEPCVEWNAGVSWYHSGWHDHQNTQVGTKL